MRGALFLMFLYCSTAGCLNSLIPFWSHGGAEKGGCGHRSWQGGLTPFLPPQELHPAAGAAPQEGSSHRAGVRDPALPPDLPQIQSRTALHAGHGLPLHLQVGLELPHHPRGSHIQFCTHVPWGCGAARSEDLSFQGAAAFPGVSLPSLLTGTTCGQKAMPRRTTPSGGQPRCRTAWRGSQTSSLTL